MNLFGYSNNCIRILDIWIWISESLLFLYSYSVRKSIFALLWILWMMIDGEKMLDLEMMIKEQKKVIEMQKDVILDQRKTIEKLGNKNRNDICSLLFWSASTYHHKEQVCFTCVLTNKTESNQSLKISPNMFLHHHNYNHNFSYQSFFKPRFLLFSAVTLYFLVKIVYKLFFY